jgi:protein ImuB
MKRIACILLTDADGNSPLEQRRLQIVECCGRFTPIVGFEPSDGQSMLLDITGLAHLFGGEAAMLAAIVRDLRELGFTVRGALAGTIGAAWAAVHYGRMQNGKCEMQSAKWKVENAKCKMQNAKCKFDISNFKSLTNESTDNPTDNISAPACNSHVSFCNLQFAFCILHSSSFLFDLPVESLRLPPDTLRLLHDLGLSCVGQLEAIPREEFLSRFGPTLLRRLDQAFGRVDEALPACPLPPKFEVRWSAEHPTVRRETIAAALERLIARVAAMLGRCGRGALRLDCRLDLESTHQRSALSVPRLRRSSVEYNLLHDTACKQAVAQRGRECGGLSLSVGLFQPTVNAKRLFELVELQLERLRIASPVTAVHITASLHAPLEPRRQAMLFELDGDARQPRQLAALVERLASRLGSKAVAGVRLRPEAQLELSWRYDPLVGRQRKTAGMACHAWQAVGRVPLLRRSSAGDDLSFGTACKQAVAHDVIDLRPRPLRLFTRPLPLDVTAIAPDGPPLRFKFDGQEQAVAQSWGPERIETGWWRGRSIGRDYFRVETTGGSRYWLFRRLRDGKWFLHGLFE